MLPPTIWSAPVTPALAPLHRASEPWAARLSSRSQSILKCAVALTAIFGAAPSLASCLSLPSTDLRTLEQRESSDPESAVSEAATRLATLTKGRDPMLEAELFAIIAAARGAQGRIDEAHDAIASSRELLNRLPPSPDTRRVTDQLAMSYVMGVETRGDLLAGVNAMNTILARAPPVQSAMFAHWRRARICALSFWKSTLPRPTVSRLTPPQKGMATSRRASRPPPISRLSTGAADCSTMRSA